MNKKQISWIGKLAKTLLKIFMVLFILLAIVVGFITYQLNIKETPLVVSESPNQENVIEIVEKGSAFLFGPSKIRIKHNNRWIERMIYNDGATLRDSNFSVEWTSDELAVITLDGGEQMPEFITFDSNETEIFKTEQVILESVTLKKSISEDQINIIEIRGVTSSTGEKYGTTLRFYYGENGGILEEYEEIAYYGADDFEIDWLSNSQASIVISREDEVVDTVEIIIE